MRLQLRTACLSKILETNTTTFQSSIDFPVYLRLMRMFQNGMHFIAFECIIPVAVAVVAVVATAVLILRHRLHFGIRKTASQGQMNVKNNVIIERLYVCVRT